MQEIEDVLIWIDDERPTPKAAEKRFPNVQVASNYVEAIIALNCLGFDGYNVYVDFDHDLGGEETGYDIAKYIVKYHIDISGFRVHSMNPVGKKNIEQLLTHYGYKLINY